MANNLQAAAMKAINTLPYSIASKELPVRVVAGRSARSRYNTGYPAIASVRQGDALSPITVDNQAAWNNPGYTPQLLRHEMTHEVQNNWPQKILNALPKINPNDPYSYGGVGGLKTIGGDPLKLSVEQQAAIEQNIAAMRQRGEAIDPIYNVFDRKFGAVPLSVMEPTAPNQKGINTMPRTPGLPSVPVWGIEKLFPQDLPKVFKER